MPEIDALGQARHFHRCFGGGGVPPRDLLEKWSDACHVLGLEPDPLTASLGAAEADLAAAEFVARRRFGASNPLTKRALILLALLEARPETSGQFVLREPDTPGMWRALAAAPFVAAVNWISGSILLWRHGR